MPSLRLTFLLLLLIVVFSGRIEYMPDDQWETCISIPDRCVTEVRVPNGYGDTKPNPNDVIPNG